jgi:Na+-transporting NADH:ubiquinone oxidoreductase subunit B
VLRKILDRLHGPFAKGKKLHRLYPLYESIDTFFYTPGEVTRTAAHVRDALDLKRMMTVVVIALLPCFFMSMHNTGFQTNQFLQGHLELAGTGEAVASAARSSSSDSAAEGATQQAAPWREQVLEYLGFGHDPDSFGDNFVLGALYFLPVYLVTLIAGGLWEVLFSLVRKHEINEGFFVTSALFPLTLPATIPLWQVALGISFGVVIGKEIFGGTGKNFMNPALVGRAFLYFAYASSISGSTVWTAADGFSGATALGALADGSVTATTAALIGYDWWTCFFGYIQGSMGETSTLACLMGALLLVATGIGSWRIMAAVTLGALATATIFWLGSGESTNAMMRMAPCWHLVLGGFAFGTVFMATDPVSAAMTDTGKWWYGGLIGAMTVLIRVINPAYPEGIMLAILFGNCMAPLFDYYVIQANIKRRKDRHAAG